MPEGYEIYEHPENAQVFLRKIRPRLITDLEEQLVKNKLNALKSSKRYILECKDEILTIYESNADLEHMGNIFGGLLDGIPSPPGTTNANDAMTALVNMADQHYTAMLRFTLDDKVKRKFVAERFCFRGSFDDWITLSGPNNLRSIVERYLSTLGKDAFFEL